MENALIFLQILSTNSLELCMEISVENCMWILGLKGFICRIINNALNKDSFYLNETL